MRYVWIIIVVVVLIIINKAFESSHSPRFREVDTSDSPRFREREVDTSGLHNALQQSDDYNTYRMTFVRASTQLIRSRRCSVSDFAEWGGWLRSVNRGPNFYFTYCGGAHLDNKIYLNVVSGELE